MVRFTCLACRLLGSLSLLLTLARAANDWSKPCFDGQCSYDVVGPVSGSLSISGTSTAISDLTEAAGWSILDCDPNSTGQNLRAVCTNASAGCEHLYQGDAVGTIVRMPENCTQMPFARIADMWLDGNQTAAYSPRRRRNFFFPLPDPLAFIFDTKFHAVDPSRNGPVSVQFHGASAGHGKSAQPKRAFGSFNKTDTEQAPSIVVSKHATLLDDSTACPSVTVDGVSAACRVQVALDLASNVSATYGVTLTGSLIPPKLTDFSLNTGLNGVLDGTLVINSTGQITVQSPSLTLFQVGIPGLDIPGILSIGPTFQVDANAVVTLGLDVDATVGVSYTLDNAQLSFPSSSSNADSGSFTPKANNLHFATDSSEVTGDASLTVNIVPSIAFGITAFEEVLATVNLDLDAFATLGLEGQDSSSAIASINGTANSTSPEDGFSGCLDLRAGVNVTAGADASLFSLFSDGESVTLFSQSVDLFQKCFS